MNSLGWSGHDISRDGAQVGEPVRPAQKQSEQESRSNDSAWHLDKKVNFSHIVATLTLAAAIFTWGSKIEQRIALVEASSTRQAQVDQAQDQEFRRSVVEMREDIRELSRKIDKLIDSRGGR